MIYKLQTVKNYPDDGNHQEVIWMNIFMPFDVVKGLDSLPPDNKDYDNYKKTNWWVCPRTQRATVGVQDISTFIKNIPTKECESLDQAIAFCIGWRLHWLTDELNKIV